MSNDLILGTNFQTTRAQYAAGLISDEEFCEHLRLAHTAHLISGKEIREIYKRLFDKMGIGRGLRLVGEKDADVNESEKDGIGTEPPIVDETMKLNVKDPKVAIGIESDKTVKKPKVAFKTLDVVNVPKVDEPKKLKTGKGPKVADGIESDKHKTISSTNKKATKTLDVISPDLTDSNLFKQRVKRLVTMTPGECVKFAAFLKTLRPISKWSDADIIEQAATNWHASKETEEDEADPTPIVPTAVVQSNLRPVTQQLESVASVEFHLNEANKKLVTASSILAKALDDASRANIRAEEAMKNATQLKLKADDARMRVDEAQEFVVKSQQEVADKSAELARVSRPTPLIQSDIATMSIPEPLHLARKNIPKSIKTLVWNKHIGPDVATAKCVSCRDAPISIRSFHCGHVIAESKGGDTNIANLRPICGDCNGSMGVMSMNEFTFKFFGWTV